MEKYPSKLKLTNFKSDGCSGGLSQGWKWLMGHPPFFESCCIWHDYEYDIGGTEADRWAADYELFKCVYDRSPIWAYIIFIAVRIGGKYRFVWKWNKYEYTLDK